MSERHDDPIAQAIRRAADRIAPITLAEVSARGRIDLDGVPRDGEPVTDALVQSHEGGTTGGPAVVIDLERVQEAGAGAASPPRRERRRWPLIAAAAALVAVVAAVGWAAADRDDRVELAPADGPAPVDETGADDALQRGTMLVDGFLGDYNDGDPYAWPAPEQAELMKLIDPAYVHAGDRWTRTGPCRLDDGDGIVCPILRRDDFHGAAGLSLEEDHVFRFDDRGLLVRLALLDADPWAEHLAFRADFRAWVTEQRPEVGMRWFPPEGAYSDELADMPTAESMPDALALLDDFVAQSDRWGY